VFSYAYYWSSTEYSSYSAYYLRYSTINAYNPGDSGGPYVDDFSKYGGFQVRCVK
jgi:hypothetical protein